MSARIDLADRIDILETHLQRLRGGKDAAGLEAAAIEDELAFMRWADKNRDAIRFAHQITAAKLDHVMPILIGHAEATRKFAERVDRAERDKLADTVRETFPGAEITDLHDEGELHDCA